MFYSHEILNSQQHGVATIWLIATVGPRGGARKVTRKAIQGVDVKRACKTIIEPGAPLALRLQGNLLYGVSRVYSQQCKYVLTDATKVQQDMMLFCQLMDQNATDPDAGKVAREHNILEDDPNFVLEPNIPHFDFDADGNTLLMPSQSSSRNGYSQLSPMGSVVNSSGGRAASMLSYNLSQSDLASLHLPTPLAHKSSGKRTTLEEARIEQVQELNDMDAVGDIELEIDADGNILGFLDPFDEADLPPLPFPDLHEDDRNVDLPHADKNLQDHAHQEQEHQPFFDGDGDVLMMDDAHGAPVAEGVQLAGQDQQNQSDTIPVSNAPLAKKRKAHNISADDTTNHCIPTLKKWQAEYLERNQKEVASNYPPKVSIADARINAFHVTFGQGMAGVGRPNGVVGFEHPLAQLFAGDSLKRMVLGIEPVSPFGSEDGHRRRRSASQAFSEDHDIEDARRVRPRLNESPQPNDTHENNGQQDIDDMGFAFGDDAAPEEARKDLGGLDDRLSSSLMPWNRTPSVHRPSSAMGSKQRAGSSHAAGSPRDHTVAPIERYSDAVGGPSSDMGFNPAPSVHSDFEEFGPAAFVTTQEAQESQWMHSALDKASNEFLDFANEQARHTGGLLEGDTDGRLWIEFEELAPPGKYPKIVAAQAFLHVLTLATKNVIKVDQDVENNEPFGTIHLGTMVDLETDDDSQTDAQGED